MGEAGQVATVPYMQGSSDRISSRFLMRLNTKTVHIPAKRNVHLLRPVEDDPGLKILGTYCIPGVHWADGPHH
jgi:hypothetical protein